ncbi:MAG: MBL fold metallo-hydrolase [Eubacteriales bacterium]
MLQLGKCVVHFLPAKAGDCILLELDNPSCILIDCGFKFTYTQELKPLLQRLSSEGYHVSLLIVTHMDCDHIEGAISFLKDNGSAETPKIIPIENIWVNGFFNTLFRRPEFDTRRAMNLTEIELRKRNSGLQELQMQMRDDGPISAGQCRAFEVLCVQGGYCVNRQFTHGIVKCTAKNRDEALMTSIAIAGCHISVFGPSEPQLYKLAKKLDREMIGWFGRDYKIVQDDNFALLFEWLMELYKDPMEEEHVAAMGTNLESWLNTSTLAQMNEINRASIVVEIDYQGKRMLFTGDGESNDWVEMLAPDYHIVKLSHHGTTKPNDSLLKKSNMKRVLISTNGENYNHPEDELLARTILSGTKDLFFNYQITRKPKLLEFQEQYGFSVHFGEQTIILEDDNE